MLTASTIRAVMRHSGVTFGTSGARGRVDAMTDEVCFAYADAFLRHLEASGQLGGRRRLALAGDRRSSTPRILEAVAFAAVHRGFELDACGPIPTPALALWSGRERTPAIMVTGSHVADDRNGIKFYSPTGEITKADEAAMLDVEVVSGGPFDGQGARTQAFPNLSPSGRASDFYVRRYLDAFGSDCLSGVKLGFYGHSGVGRDVLPAMLEQLGADVVRVGYSESFVAVDTEAIRPQDVALAAQWAQEHDVDAIVTTDGDADRPLVSDEQGRWIRGDVAGILCARHLGAKVVVTPVSSNTGVEQSGYFDRVVRTRIGSPYVIEGMNQAIHGGEGGVVGYEANGGFLMGSSLLVDGRPLEPLMTRDAAIVLVSLLRASRSAEQPLSAMLRDLPARYTASDRLTDFQTPQSVDRIETLRKKGPPAMNAAFGEVAGQVLSVDATDGLRMRFASGEIIHLRPSGNAPELRCYVEAATEARSRTVLAGALAVLEGWRV